MSTDAVRPGVNTYSVSVKAGGELVTGPEVAEMLPAAAEGDCVLVAA